MKILTRLLVLISLLGLVAACTPARGGGGGSDDDDAAGDDDDAASGDAILTFTFGNETGYDFTEGAISFTGPGGTAATTFGAVATGDTSTDIATIENAAYGEDLTVVATAIDIDGDCYDWPEQTYEIAATIDIAVIFTFDMWLGGGCPE